MLLHPIIPTSVPNNVMVYFVASKRIRQLLALCVYSSFDRVFVEVVGVSFVDRRPCLICVESSLRILVLFLSKWIAFYVTPNANDGRAGKTRCHDRMARIHDVKKV